MAKQITLQIELSGAGGVVRGIKGINGSMVELRKGAEKDGMQFGRVMDFALGGLAANAIAGVHQRLLNLAGDSFNVGREVENSLADLEAITGITGENLQELGRTAVAESIRTGVAAAEQIEAFKLLASNIDIATIGGIEGLKALGQEAVLLSQTSKDLGLADAAIAVAGGINMWGEEASEAARITNVLAAGAKYGAAEIPDLSAAIKESGATAAAASQSYEVTVGALEVMSQRMLKGSQAGTNLRNIFTILQTSGELFAKRGLHDINIEGDGLVETLRKLQPLLSDSAGMAKIFGRENLNAAQILIQNADAIEVMTERVTGTTVATEQAAAQTDNLDGSLAKLVALMKAGAIDGYAGVQDELKGLIDATITGVLWLGNHRDEMAMAARIAAVLAVAVGGLTIAKNAGTIATKLATVAENLYTAAIARSIQATVALRAIMASNPWLLAATALATLGAAMLLFRKRTDDATVSLEQQRKEVQGLAADIDQLASSELFQRYSELKAQQAEVNEQLAETKRLLEENNATRDRSLTQIRESADLRAREKELGEQLHTINTSIAQAVAQGARGLEARRDVLAREVEQLEASGQLTDELYSKRSELQMIEQQILSLKEKQNEEEESAEDQSRKTIEQMELELMLMEEGQAKKLATITLHVEQEIEKYREQYEEQYPELFRQLEVKLREERDRLIAAMSQDGGAVPVPIKLAPEFELPEGEIDLGEFLVDGLVRLNGALDRVNHNLNVLQQRYMQAQTAQERWDIFQKITELQALQGEAEMMQRVMEQFSNAGVDAFAALGEGIGASLAGVEGAMDDMAVAMKLILADLAKSIGQMLLRQAAALALAGMWGRAGRLTAAGTGLIAFGALLEGRIKEGQRRDEERKRELDRNLSPDGTTRDWGEGSRTENSSTKRLGSTIFGMPNQWVEPGDSISRRQSAYPTLASITPEGVLQMGSQKVDQHQLEEAVASAVVKGIGSIEFQAAGTALKSVRTRTDSRNEMAAIE